MNPCRDPARQPTEKQDGIPGLSFGSGRIISAAIPSHDDMRTSFTDSCRPCGVDLSRFWLHVLALFLATRVLCPAAEVSRLSLIKDAEFPEWLTGTEWEFSPKQGKRRIWFATTK